MTGWNEPKLDELFAAYRDAVPDREASAAFMPELWKRIEQRRKQTFNFGRFARGFVSAAAAFCLAMGAITWSPSSNPIYTSSYIDVLDDDLVHDVDTLHGETL
jgi:hypothetical protein